MKVMATIKYDSDPSVALKLEDYPIPKPAKDEVLVKILAASVNPIDARIRSGYGRALFAPKAPLPIVLGRDFAGVITEIGAEVEQYNIGDEVFGVVSPFRPAGMKYGSHGEYVCVPLSDITKKPSNINFIEAASLPYVALTTFSALITQAGLQVEDYHGKNVFLHAGAGGVGSYTIQFLKALGAHVTTTCSTKNIAFLNSLGADEIIDYTKSDYTAQSSRFDVAYDLLGKTHTETTVALLKSSTPSPAIAAHIDELSKKAFNSLNSADATWDVPRYKNIIKQFDKGLAEFLPANAPRYSSIIGPLMPLTDTKGLLAGLYEFVKTTIETKALQAKHHGRLFNYALFEPNQQALILLSQQLETGPIKPCINVTFPLEQAAQAHTLVESGHVRGKIMLSMQD